MQSKYFSPFSLNIYCPLAEIILSGSALKNNLHDGLHCNKIKKKMSVFYKKETELTHKITQQTKCGNHINQQKRFKNVV